MAIKAYQQTIPIYQCPKCGINVPRGTVDDSDPDSLFACDCGWQGEATDLHVTQKRLYGRDALRVAQSAGAGIH
jgi:predicted RNA-binding Zn-ribbon protein involved in translation (DUF1610 family)